MDAYQTLMHACIQAERIPMMDPGKDMPEREGKQRSKEAAKGDQSKQVSSSSFALSHMAYPRLAPALSLFLPRLAYVRRDEVLGSGASTSLTSPSCPPTASLCCS